MLSQSLHIFKFHREEEEGWDRHLHPTECPPCWNAEHGPIHQPSGGWEKQLSHGGEFNQAWITWDCLYKWHVYLYSWCVLPCLYALWIKAYTHYYYSILRQWQLKDSWLTSHHTRASVKWGTSFTRGISTPRRSFSRSVLRKSPSKMGQPEWVFVTQACTKNRILFNGFWRSCSFAQNDSVY